VEQCDSVGFEKKWIALRLRKKSLSWQGVLSSRPGLCSYTQIFRLGRGQLQWWRARLPTQLRYAVLSLGSTNSIKALGRKGYAQLAGPVEELLRTVSRIGIMLVLVPTYLSVLAGVVRAARSEQMRTSGLSIPSKYSLHSILERRRQCLRIPEPPR
jgi:hypothetical protein